MTISVLDRRDGPAEEISQGLSLGQLHDAADQVDDELLPCRVNNPELWFAESPQRRGVRQGAVHGLPGPRPVPRRRPRAREPWGVWGGQLFLQGVVIPRKRPRGRPRKNEVAA